jgi:uncharacterized protein YjeT (DUF2065 family)
MKFAITLLCWGWIALGIWWFFRPKGIKRRFEKKFHKTARWVIVVVLFTVGGALFSIGWRSGGMFGTILAIVAIIAALKGLLFVRGQLADRILTWWGEQPDGFYRLSAATMVVVGAAVQWLMSKS